ncbi:hypothetical protein Ddc_10551 [Ditylenchus destructor]|nr:hypothetical protein Ddc_10551 [Ditylenchus destructor]
MGNRDGNVLCAYNRGIKVFTSESSLVGSKGNTCAIQIQEFLDPTNPPAAQSNISTIIHPKNTPRPSNVLPKPKSSNATTMKVAIPSTSNSSTLINNSIQNCAKTCTITNPNSSNSSAKSPKPRPPPKPSKDVVERALANNGTNASRNGTEKSNGKIPPATKPKPKVAENVKKVPENGKKVADNPKTESDGKRTVIEDQKPGTSESVKSTTTMKLESQSLNSRSARSQGRPKVKPPSPTCAKSLPKPKEQLSPRLPTETTQSEPSMDIKAETGKEEESKTNKNDDSSQQSTSGSAGSSSKRIVRKPSVRPPPPPTSAANPPKMASTSIGINPLNPPKTVMMRKLMSPPSEGIHSGDFSSFTLPSIEISLRFGS